tara:strand:+ start:111 stop:824 length:714 start_codon:yes stop_codon:yes gene_type:complete
MKNTAVVNCSAMKLDYECEAQELYSKSYVFRAQVEFLSHTYDDWYILSAKYGIVKPTDIIEPYDLSFRVSRRGKGNVITPEDLNNLKVKVNNQTQILLENSKVDIHASFPYWKLFNKDIQKQITKVKQQRNQPSTMHSYQEALELYKQGTTLDDCLTHISTIKQPKNPEVPKYFYHRNHQPFLGKAYDLCKEYLELDAGMAYRVSLGKNPHHKGWTIDEALSKTVFQLPGGSWRIKK